MPLNKSKGNMYEFVTHTWNTIKGKCFHDCSYCYCKDIAKRFNKPQSETYFDERELKTNLGNGNFIFVGSSCDMFAENIPDEWIEKTLDHMAKYDNKYLIQTKNPARIGEFILPKNTSVCCTIETNRHYSEIMGNSPRPIDRSIMMSYLTKYVDTYITIEPIMDFDLEDLVSMILICSPKQVNIGADSGKHNLTEPSKEKILLLIDELQKFTTIHNKSNLKRLLK